MHKPSLFSFIFLSIAAGLAGFLALQLLYPELTQPTFTWQDPSRPQLQAKGPFSYASAVQLAAPAVVNIYTTKRVRQRFGPLTENPLWQHLFGSKPPSRSRQRFETSLGSGVIIGLEGYILTNYHVIQDADQIKVALTDERFPQAVDAHVIGNDPETDLSVLKIELPGVTAITLANGGPPQVGDVVLAIGNPFGVGQTVTMGIVSATGRKALGLSTFENFIQTDAAINEGNSGGALINTRGELIGINTALLSRSGGSHGIGFAIPINLVQGVMQQILKHGHVVRGWLGIESQDLNPVLAEALGVTEAQGVVIIRVVRDSPADRKGLRAGDIISHLDGKAITDSRSVLKMVTEHSPGTRLEIRGWRGKKPFSIDVRLIQRPLHLG